MTNYQRGANKERRIVNKFRKEGQIALRSAGSHSEIDIVAIDFNSRIIRLIQSKLGYLPPGERKRILESGQKFNGDYKVLFELHD